MGVTIRGTPLDKTTRETLDELVRAKGEKAVMDQMSLSRNALIRALAGLPVLAGTTALIERGLERT